MSNGWYVTFRIIWAHGQFGDVGRAHGRAYNHAQEASGSIRRSGHRLPSTSPLPSTRRGPPGVVRVMPVSTPVTMRPWPLGGHPAPTLARARTACSRGRASLAEHLALEHLKAIDMPLHRARTPREGHTNVDGVVVLVEPLAKRARPPTCSWSRASATDRAARVAVRV